MSRAAPPERPRPPQRQAGFTLVEVLVALAVTAAVLSAIGLLVGGNARATRALERRAALVSAAQAVEAGLPPRDQLREGRLEGSVAGHAWRMDVSPLDVGDVPDNARWAPRDVRIRVTGPDGGAIEIETVRLVPTGKEDDTPADAEPGAAKGSPQ